MVINKIYLKNFYRYGNTEQQLDLTGSGITAITGLNGYGKSTSIVDSLLFAFYGKYRCDTIDGVVNRYTGKNTKVSVEFTQNGKNYKIIRYRKHETHNNNIYIFEGDHDISGHTAAETNNIILDVIKMPYIAFTNSCVFSSELYSAFLANKNSDRLAVFENILSLKEISLLYTETKSILKELENNKNEILINKEATNREISTINSTIDNYNNNAKSKLLQMKSDKESYKKIIEEANNKIKELSIIDVDKERAKLNNITLKEEYENNLKKLNDEKKTLEVNIPAEWVSFFEKYKNVNFEENKLKEQKYNEDLETIKSRENGYKLSFEKLSSLKKDKNDKENLINNNKSKILEFNLKIEKLNSATCPFCGQHLTNEKAEEELNKINKSLKEAEEEINDITSQLDKINKDIEEETENYNWLLKDYNERKNNLNNSFIPNSDVVFEKFKNISEKLNDANQQRIKNSIRFEEIEKEEKEINRKLDKLEISSYNEEELNSISLKIENEKNSITELEKKIAAIDGSVNSVYDKSYVDSLKNKLSNKQKEFENIDTDYKKIEDDILHYNYLADIFSNKSGGFKKYFIGEMISIFNEKVNQFLPFFFTEKMEIIFDKDLNDVIKMDDYEIGFSSLSQGQRQRAELAVSFALFEVARVYFSNDNKLLILDEMDKGLDKYGIKSMINLLKGFDNQLRIFIVSHNPLLDEEVDSKIKITRDENGFSVINQ